MHLELKAHVLPSLEGKNKGRKTNAHTPHRYVLISGILFLTNNLPTHFQIVLFSQKSNEFKFDLVKCFTS